MHALEKILARAAGVPAVKAGEIVNAKVDLAEVNDLYLQVLKSFHEMGGTKVHDPNKVTFVLDHYAPAPTIQSAANQKAMREFVWDQGIPHLFDIDAGVCHQVMPEAGLVFPGMLLVATDSHTTTHGAFGAFGTGVGATDLACILLTGELWLRVPEVIKVELTGTLPHGVMAKDVVLHVLGKLKADAAAYKAVEYTGEVVKNLGMAERMVLCNMAVEMGAKTAYIAPDEVTRAYLEPRLGYYPVVPTTDSDYVYVAMHSFDVTDFEPQLAAPHSVDNLVGISEVAGIKVDQAFIGTCTGGRVEDIAVAAEILKGKKISQRTRLVIIPASREVFLTATKLGYVETLIEAGATFSTPGCGPCLGAHQGALAPGEVCVTASSRNFPGRMGSTQAEIYVASPAVCAASALEGKLADPRKYLCKEAATNEY
ncbi:MAG: 3-isopropylmalate/(R)-2-methylmalate dehydratase large subunit [Bacillota bacterium]|nr:MAG: 3-isopropylmalate/(R)-2-methylmalate dehydratase large subunit [Bacillota bacterium]